MSSRYGFSAFWLRRDAVVQPRFDSCFGERPMIRTEVPMCPMSPQRSRQSRVRNLIPRRMILDTFGIIWVCLKMLCTPKPNGWWSLSLLNGYFIGNIPNIFRQTHLCVDGFGAWIPDSHNSISMNQYLRDCHRYCVSDITLAAMHRMASLNRWYIPEVFDHIQSTYPLVN